MENITYALAIIVMAAVAVVLVRGLFHMMRGGDGVTSNKLMQMRILLQFIAIVLIVGDAVADEWRALIARPECGGTNDGSTEQDLHAHRRRRQHRPCQR